MSSIQTSLNHTLTQLLKGDLRLKRVEIRVTSKHHPETPHSGYAIVTELNDKVLSFFCTHKFRIDECLTVHANVNGEAFEFELRMSHLHEQISSGRIMHTLPTEAQPFPAMKYYRCFAQVLDVKQNGLSLRDVGESRTPTLTDVSIVPTALEDVPIAA